MVVDTHFSACHLPCPSGKLVNEALYRYPTKSRGRRFGLCRRPGISGVFQSFLTDIVSKRTDWRAIAKILAKVGTGFSNLRGTLRVGTTVTANACDEVFASKRAFCSQDGWARAECRTDWHSIGIQDRVPRHCRSGEASGGFASCGRGPKFQQAPDAIVTRGA